MNQEAYRDVIIFIQDHVTIGMEQDKKNERQ